MMVYGNSNIQFSVNIETRTGNNDRPIETQERMKINAIGPKANSMANETGADGKIIDGTFNMLVIKDIVTSRTNTFVRMPYTLFKRFQC
mmetsp:Transcript_17082/g.33313  ORF Transcript_17082/g.33313 Transcript_17082/m.33313 type:complete len:89 (-) Transcript_17082:112-378(-)